MPEEIKEHPELEPWIARLAAIHHETPALQTGGYEEIHVAGSQLAFLRRSEEQLAVIIVNAAHEAAPLRLGVAVAGGTVLTDALDPASSFTVQEGFLDLGDVPAATTMILVS